MSEEINEIMEGIDKNIKNLEDAEQINLQDVQTLLVMLFGVLKDMFERFQGVFEQVEKVKEIEKATAKGEEYEVKISDDVERLYQ